MRRLAAGLAGGTEPHSDLRRTITIRNVALAVLGASVLVLKSGYHGPFADVLNAYAGNVAVSFALYFAVINATARFRRPRMVATALTFLAVQLFEVTDGFGVMDNVSDPADVVANTFGIGLAVIVDVVTGRALQRRHEQRRLEMGRG